MAQVSEWQIPCAIVHNSGNKETGATTSPVPNYLYRPVSGQAGHPAAMSAIVASRGKSRASCMSSTFYNSKGSRQLYGGQKVL